MIPIEAQRFEYALRAPACPPEGAIDYANEEKHGNYDLPRIERGRLHHWHKSDGRVLLHRMIFFQDIVRRREASSGVGGPITLITLDAMSRLVMIAICDQDPSTQHCS